ncbi:hypothetical protein BDR07DRAFT_1609247 [Suillus spraguei]|nr:hypothetical protein BDR07DRAFT_1609247 [Suillus spraguei]
MSDYWKSSRSRLLHGTMSASTISTTASVPSSTVPDHQCECNCNELILRVFGLGEEHDCKIFQEKPILWAPPLAPQTQNVDDDLAGPESISLDEINATFALLEHKKDTMERAD